MFASPFVIMMETALLSMEACRVIALRTQVLMLGGVAALDEAELMVGEKNKAFLKAFVDLSCGGSHSDVRAEIRTIVQGNIARLTAPIG